MLQNVWCLPIHALFACLWICQSSIPEHPFSPFFHPFSPNLNFPVFFTSLLFLSLSHLSLILCPFIKTTKKNENKNKKRLKRKFPVVFLQIPQCPQVVHNNMTAFETVNCIQLYYMHTRIQRDDGSMELVREYRLTVNGCSEWSQHMWNRLLWWKRVKDKDVGEGWRWDGSIKNNERQQKKTKQNRKTKREWHRNSPSTSFSPVMICVWWNR